MGHFEIEKLDYENGKNCLLTARGGGAGVCFLLASPVPVLSCDEYGAASRRVFAHLVNNIHSGLTSLRAQRRAELILNK